MTPEYLAVTMFFWGAAFNATDMGWNALVLPVG